jgi:hypothetical protein
VVIPLVLLLLVVGAVAVLFVRGTWADATPRNPASPADGAVAQLYQPPREHKRVRAAILLPFSRETVWKVVTDYGHYGDFLPYLADVKAEPVGEGVWHMTGQAKSALQGYWDFAIDIHEEKTGDRWVALWDQPGGQVEVNRGSWTVTLAGNGQTLLVLELEAEVRHYPTFFLRNFFLHRLKQVLRAVDRRLKSQEAGG